MVHPEASLTAVVPQEVAPSTLVEHQGALLKRVVHPEAAPSALVEHQGASLKKVVHPEAAALRVACWSSADSTQLWVDGSCLTGAVALRPAEVGAQLISIAHLAEVVAEVVAWKSL